MSGRGLAIESAPMGWVMQVARCAVVLAVGCALGACASIMNRATSGLGDRLGAGVLNQDDPATVAAGLPAYLLLLDGLIEGDVDNADLLLAAARLYGAYGGGFVSDPERRARLALRALEYAKRATCARDDALCKALDGSFDAFDAQLVHSEDVQLLYGLGSAWTGLIEARSDDLDRIAELPQVQALFKRVVALDPGYDGGSAWMYLGVLSCLRPASLGGEPDAGRAAFAQAIERSGGRNQMARVLYAQYYARLVFDQELHDRLLGEALAADPHAPGLTLLNVLAQQRARELLESGKDYF